MQNKKLMYQGDWYKIEHPELKPGEVFLCNTFFKRDDRYDRYKTKRFGVIAYTLSGKSVFGATPVFISEKEYWKEALK